ncbi:YhcH/YjgK/YiaL family protein [Paenibacillus sp. LMG 31460]|uniref:YhcH/YjgK/YiaL family protein n=1 Tax=Paenibacillus germinis TaxID=2654979 RepID=A0ABX1YWQ6_9BACL|nr:YhcH/YjgK/YiaL family protein [Paenibacillus germinis]NOU85353.1 YhcH/YjgK/YiaL family protein [Paenibacillus germinis]
MHKRTDSDLIWFASRNLLLPQPLFSDYQMTYFGGWQEMFPEVSETHVYRGATLHRGESALVPWDYEIVKDDPDEVIILLTARMQSMPFQIEKTICLKSLSSKVRIDIAFYDFSIEEESVIYLKPGMFVVIFPTDVHRPCCCAAESTRIKKIVIKIHKKYWNDLM